jgi:hypothetical protein
MAHSPAHLNDPQNISRPAAELPPEFREILHADPLFASLAAWTFQPVRGGSISPHTYRMVSPGKDFFVKAVTPNEKYTLQLISLAGLSIAPAVHSGRLLEEGCLVTDFIPGDRLMSKRLPPALVREVAQMHNVLNDQALFERSTTPSSCKYSDHDDGFYRQSLLTNFRAGRQLLQALATQYHLPSIDQFQRVADSLAANLEVLAEVYAGMPFAWLHNDFREDNILGDPPRLVDWGSSYGHGPFLVDLAPFLVDDPDGFRLFIGESDIAKFVDQRVLKRWQMAALGARFVECIRWRIALEGGNVGTAQDCRAFLEYEGVPFRHLLGYKF